MRSYTIIILLLLSGCTTVPVSRDFPVAVNELMQACPDLQQTAPGTTKLSEVLSIVATNYGQYHECRAKVDAWIKWYGDQKKVYETVK